MELAWRIAQVIIPVFLIVGVGYWYGRRALPDLTMFNRIVLDVMTPVLVYTALAGKEFRLAEHAVLLGAGAALILLTGAGAWIVSKFTRTDARSLVPVVMFTNCGNMGLPLALLAFGPAGFGAAVGLFSISNLIHFSLGARITSAHAGTKELLLSPLMIASALGFASAATGIRPPDVIFTGLKMLGEPMLPLMLLSLGVRLTQLKREDVPRGLLGAFARPLIGLAIALPLAHLLQLEGMPRGQLLLFAALPPAVMQFMLAERYRQEPERVAAMVLLGNALAIVFVPVGLALSL